MQISSVLIIISGHSPDLQTANINLVHDGHNLKNINFKI